MLAWWQKDNKALLHWEIESLQCSGFIVGDISTSDETGECSVCVSLMQEEEKIELKVLFPLTYPENPPEIIASSLKLKHHMNPVEKNLCTLARPLTNWNRDWSLAGFLQTQIPLVLSAGRESDPLLASEIEAHQAEPASAFLQYEAQSVVLIDATAVVDDNIRSGHLELSILANESLFKATLFQVSRKGTVSKHTTVANPWAPTSQITGKWVRATTSPVGYSAEDYLALLRETNHTLTDPKWYQLSDQVEIAIYGILFQEELKWREEKTSWVFIAERRKRNKAEASTVSFVRAMRADRETMLIRLPFDQDFSDITVVQFGLGCVGAPLAIELAKVGLGGLTLVDHDLVEPGPTVRWPIGLAYSGEFKAIALYQFINQNFPLSKVKPLLLRFGSALGDVTRAQYDEALKGANLIVDATAEITVTWALADIAREQKLPFISISTTPGGQSGQIVFIRPDDELCAECIAHHQNDGTLPSPPKSDHGEIQPAGCSEPTFKAAGFDTSQISLAAARCVISALLTNPKNTMIGNYFMLTLEDEVGLPILPIWKSFSPARHPACQKHP